jgi:hypothetical protein
VGQDGSLGDEVASSAPHPESLADTDRIGEFEASTK